MATKRMTTKAKKKKKKRRGGAPRPSCPADPVHLDPDALDWALAHACEFGDTVFLPPAFEFDAIEHQWHEIKAWLLEQDMRQWRRRPERRFLANKGPFSFRYVTQLDPLEHLAFAALIHKVGDDLEAQRPDPAENQVFSWRFKPSPAGAMYDPSFKFSRFNRQCLENAKRPTCNFVVVADIADFFSHIYLHPIEAAFDQVGDQDAAWCVVHMIKNWNGKASYGLPIGLAASRIIAEATIADVDRTLRSQDVFYCRYSDDFRLFCDDEKGAFRALELLTEVLFENHGLTLNTEKTFIIPAGDYIQRFTMSPDRLEAEALEQRFREWLEEQGLDDDYDADFDDLDDDQKQELEEWNLDELLDSALSSERADPLVISFLLHRLGQLGVDHADKILPKLGQLGHVIADVAQYFLKIMEDADTVGIGEALVDACSCSTLSTYHRTCMLSAFGKSDLFNHEGRFRQLYDDFPDQRVQREVTLALGQAGDQDWFRMKRRDFQALPPWQRRAFLAGFSCVSENARQPFYQSLGTKGAELDPLDDAVIEWAIANPLG